MSAGLAPAALAICEKRPGALVAKSLDVLRGLTQFRTLPANGGWALHPPTSAIAATLSCLSYTTRAALKP